MPDAKFACGSLSSFGDMMSQNFPLEKGTSHQIRRGFNIKRISFYVQIRSFRLKIDPHVNFRNFQAEETFFISKFRDL